jgi:hypothetical protein
MGMSAANDRSALPNIEPVGLTAADHPTTTLVLYPRALFHYRGPTAQPTFTSPRLPFGRYSNPVSLLKGLSEACRAAAHDLALANEFSVELRTVESEVDIEIHTVEGALRSVHALEILLEILAAQIRCQCHDLLDACSRMLVNAIAW